MGSIVREAAQGDANSIKTILKFGRRFIPTMPKPEPSGAIVQTEIAQADVDYWRSCGYFPAACPAKIEDIDEATLTRAAKMLLRAGRRRRADQSATTEKK
jgi:hypothetical protein